MLEHPATWCSTSCRVKTGEIVAIVEAVSRSAETQIVPTITGNLTGDSRCNDDARGCCSLACKVERVRSHHSQVVRVSPTDEVRAVEHLQVLRTSRRPDQRIDLTLPHQQFRRPLLNLQRVRRVPNYYTGQ